MPVKGDITDFVEAHSNLSTNELISRLEKAIARSALAKPIALAYQRNEKKNRDREEREKLASFPNWSQSDIAEYLAEKYQSSLAWNTNLQEWYYYGSVTPGIWSKGSTERIGKLVKSEIGAIALDHSQLFLFILSEKVPIVAADIIMVVAPIMGVI